MSFMHEDGCGSGPSEIELWVVWLPETGVSVEHPAVIEPCCDEMASDLGHVIECHLGGHIVAAPVNSRLFAADADDRVRGQMVVAIVRHHMEQLYDLYEARQRHLASRWN